MCRLTGTSYHASVEGEIVSASLLPEPRVIETFRLSVYGPPGAPEWLEEALLAHLDSLEFRAAIRKSARLFLEQAGMRESSSVAIE